MALDAHQKKLLTIFGLFFVPLAIAATWYLLLPADYRPGSMTNNGNLITPIYPIAAFTQKTRDGDDFSGKDLEKKWTLVHLIKGHCGEECSKWLYNTRQIRIALAEDMDRVNRLAVVDSTAAATDNRKMWESHPDMRVIIGAQGGLAEQIRQHTAAQSYPEHSVFLIDPLGNLMMQFPPDINPKLLMKDLEKLLKLSHIG
jgi:cytochrome oxidase Cu insertion factor (SCO1/SenC/PrrC family)